MVCKNTTNLFCYSRFMAVVLFFLGYWIWLFYLREDDPIERSKYGVGDSCAIYVRNDVKGRNPFTVTATDGGKSLSEKVRLSKRVLRISIREGRLLVEEAATPPSLTSSAVKQ